MNEVSSGDLKGAVVENPHFSRKKTLLYSLLPALLLLCVMEGGARLLEIYMPPWQVDYGWGFNPESRLFIPSSETPGLMIMNPSKTVSFHEQEFFVPKKPNTFRIFMLGGSSVNYLFPKLRVLGAKLTLLNKNKRLVEFINCGGLAYGSHRLVPIASEILNYEPDLVLVYSGHNEFEELDQFRAADLKHLPLQRLLYRSAFFRFLRDRWASLQVSDMQRKKNEQILARPDADYVSGGQHEYTPQEVIERAEGFRNNLSIIISLCQAKNIPIIIGSVASNLWKPDLATDEMRQQVQSLYKQGKYEEGLALARKLLRTYGHHQASDTENEIIRDLAKRHNIPLSDVENAVIEAEPHRIPGETLLSDRCHLNDKGNAILLRVYEEQIKQVLDRASK